MATETINLPGGVSVDVSFDLVTIDVDDDTASFFLRYTFADQFGNKQIGKLHGSMRSATAMRMQVRNAIASELRAALNP